LVPETGAGVETVADLKTLPGFGAAAALSGFILSGLVAGLRASGLVDTGLVVEVDDEGPSLIEKPEPDGPDGVGPDGVGSDGVGPDGSEAAGLLKEREILTGSPSGR